MRDVFRAASLLCVFIAIKFSSNTLQGADPIVGVRGALASWGMSDTKAIASNAAPIVVKGNVVLGQMLDEPERGASIQRGGDGKVAYLDGGWLMAGDDSVDPPKNSPKLPIRGDQFSWLIRLKCAHAKLWTTRGIFSQGGGHDALSFNLFSYDFGKGPEGMRLGFEIGVEGKPGLGGQVTALVDQIGATDWHDVIARYDGKTLELYIDGVLMDHKEASGSLRSMNAEPIGIGAATFQGRADNPFPGYIDHAALWNCALTSEEIETLSGGKQAVEAAKAKFEAYQPPKASIATVDLVRFSRHLKSRFQHDPHRPRYHFVHFEEGDAMPGDANGAIWWNGRYHMFYIFQRPNEEQGGVVHCWGHASSIDLCHWEHHPTGLDVAPSDPDRGIFSGNALISREGIPTIVYHGVSAGNCMAQSHDPDLIQWTKSPHNPLVPLPRSGDPLFGKYDSWDPHCWLESNGYYAIFGGNPGTGAPASLFHGPEMHQMKYQGPFFTNDRWSEKDEDISCPDFFPLGDRHVLCCISHMRGGRCFIGKWSNGKFEAEQHVRMNWPGGAFFAPETLVDEQNRRIVWAWCMDERPEHDRVQSGWSGVLSLPRVLSLNATHEMQIEPPKELERLRFLPKRIEKFELKSVGEHGAVKKLDSIHGARMELHLEMQSDSSDYYGIKVRCAPDGSEETVIGYDPKAKLLKIDVSKSTLDPTIRYKSWCLFRPNDEKDANRKVTVQEVPLELSPGEPLKLRVFLDHSMLEVFANGRQCATQRVWPSREDSVGVSVFAKTGTVQVPYVQAWSMAATTPD